MSRQYYYLVAGLPELLFDDKKLPLGTPEYRNFLQEHLGKEDLALIKSYFWRFDNINILAQLKAGEFQHDPQANLSAELLDELFGFIKDNSPELAAKTAPGYLVKFIEAYKAETPIYNGLSWDIQLSWLYYDYACSQENEFIRNWFTFERNLNNILTAAQCRNYSTEITGQLIGENEITEKLLKSNARDFGLTDEMEYVDRIIKAAEETDLLEQERKIDLLKWEVLDSESFFHYFTIEKLFVFLIKLSLVERWMQLDKETGKKLFYDLVKGMETSFEFPAEFSLK